jgi:hypothetical protein
MCVPFLMVAESFIQCRTRRILESESLFCNNNGIIASSQIALVWIKALRYYLLLRTCVCSFAIKTIKE